MCICIHCMLDKRIPSHILDEEMSDFLSLSMKRTATLSDGEEKTSRDTEKKMGKKSQILVAARNAGVGGPRQWGGYK